MKSSANSARCGQHPAAPARTTAGGIGDNLPAQFELRQRDDGMYPVIPNGMLMQFDRTLTPRNRDVVLIRSEWGACVREFHSLGGARFEARALNHEFEVFDSETEGLEVLAVLVGVRGRMSDFGDPIARACNVKEAAHG